MLAKRKAIKLAKRISQCVIVALWKALNSVNLQPAIGVGGKESEVLPPEFAVYSAQLTGPMKQTVA